MGKVAIAAMSTSCLDYHPESHNVFILRLHILMDGKSYIDGSTLKADAFQRWMMDNPDRMATTEPPTRNEIMKFFLDIADEGYEEVIMVCLSSALSQTYEKILEVIPAFKGKLKIHLFDSKTGTFTEGFMALQAEKCIEKGMTVEQTLAHLNKLRTNNVVLFGVADLSYLISNGRLSQASGFIANMLSIKPLITVNAEGQAVVAEKVMATSRAMRAMSDYLKEHSRNSQMMVYGLHAGSQQLNQEFMKVLAERNGLVNLQSYPVSPVIAAHVGPYSFGFCAFWR